MIKSIIFWGRGHVINGVLSTKSPIQSTAAFVPVTFLTQPSLLDGFPANPVQAGLLTLKGHLYFALGDDIVYEIW